jgi:hypothetical protein
MVRDETVIEHAIKVVEQVLKGAQNSNQASEDAIVAMAAAREMKTTLAWLQDKVGPRLKPQIDGALKSANGERIPT